MDEENKNINNQDDQHSRNPNYGSKAGAEDELEKIKKQAQEYLDGWKRAKADYLNLKKEIEAQNKEIKEWMSKIFLLPLLDIMDNFDKAFVKIPEGTETAWVKGIEVIRKQFDDFFKSQRVAAIETKGQKFDPLKHEAVAAPERGEPRPDGREENDESGTIAEELQKGYLINGEVLRPAKVKVYK